MNRDPQRSTSSSAEHSTAENSKSSPWRPLVANERVHAAALGHTIRRIRRRHVPGRKRLTQADLAKLAGLSARSLASIEQGTRRVQAKALEGIATAFVELLPTIVGQRDEVLSELIIMAGPIMMMKEPEP